MEKQKKNAVKRAIRYTDYINGNTFQYSRGGKAKVEERADKLEAKAKEAIEQYEKIINKKMAKALRDLAEFRAVEYAIKNNKHSLETADIEKATGEAQREPQRYVSEVDIRDFEDELREIRSEDLFKKYSSEE